MTASSPTTPRLEVHLLRLLPGGGEQVLRTYRFEAESVTIGTDRACQLRVAGDPSLAPRHATLYLEDGQLTLVPMDGAEVLLEGEPVDIAVLQPHTLVKLGRITLRAEVSRGEERPETSPTPSPAPTREVAPAPVAPAPVAAPARDAVPAQTSSAPAAKSLLPAGGSAGASARAPVAPSAPAPTASVPVAPAPVAAPARDAVPAQTSSAPAAKSLLPTGGSAATSARASVAPIAPAPVVSVPVAPAPVAAPARDAVPAQTSSAPAAKSLLPAGGSAGASAKAPVAPVAPAPAFPGVPETRRESKYPPRPSPAGARLPSTSPVAAAPDRPFQPPAAPAAQADPSPPSPVPPSSRATAAAPPIPAPKAASSLPARPSAPVSPATSRTAPPVAKNGPSPLEDEDSAALSGLWADTGPVPLVARPKPPREIEPGWPELEPFDAEDEDDEALTPPFDLEALLLKAPGSELAEEKGPRETWCQTSLLRLRDGQVMESLNLFPGQELDLLDGRVRCQALPDGLALQVAPGIEGELSLGGRLQTLAAEDRGPAQLRLQDGDLACLAGSDGLWRLAVARPVRIPQPSPLRASPRALAFALAALLVHGAVAMVLTPGQRGNRSELDQAESFATVELRPPEPGSPPRATPPPPAAVIAERAPSVTDKVATRTAKDLSESTPAPTVNSASSLLKILGGSGARTGEAGAGKVVASVGGGAGLGGGLGSGLSTAASLKDLVSNIDAVAPGSSGGGGFNIAGTIAALPGGEVNIARKGGGLGAASGSGSENGRSGRTLRGEQVAGQASSVATLGEAPKATQVRGKVTRLSSEAKVEGSLSREDVSRVINAELHRVQACYEKSLLADPTLSGRVVFEWTVEASGRSRDVRVRSSTLAEPKVADCISALIKGWVFPQPQGGDVTISYPFLFRSF